MTRLKIAILTAAAVVSSGYSQPSDISEEQLEISGAYELEEALPEETQELLYDFDFELNSSGVGNLSFDDASSAFLNIGREELSGPFSACLSVLCMTAICAMGRTAAKDGGVSDGLDTLTAAAVVVAVFIPIAALIDRTAKIISAVCGFSAILVPVLTALAAASGHTASAATYSAFTLGVLEAINIIVPGVMLPVLRIMLGIGAVSSLSPTLGLDKLIAFLEKGAKWLMGLMGIFLSGALGISSVAASAADGVSGKAARFLISGAVPVVGGALSDAMGTIYNSIAIVRSSVGAFGIVAGLFIILPTAISAALWSMGLNLSSWAVEALGTPRVAASMRSFSSVISLLLGLTALIFAVTVCSAALMMNLRSV